jgi:hypothetical protein
MDITMNDKNALDARTDRGDSEVADNAGINSAGVAYIVNEQAPNRKYELKVLKEQVSSDLEYFTIQMRSTHHCSDDSLHDC